MPYLLVSGERVAFDEGVTIESAVSARGMHPDSYLYLIDGRPVPMDTVPEAGAVVKVMRVASGG